MKKIDINTFTGHWPFRKVYNQSIESISSYMERDEVERALVSSFDSIFYNDAFEGDEDLHASILGNQKFHMVMTVNPKIPGWQKDLEYECEHFHVCAVKVFPTYHNYLLKDPDFLELVSVLEKKNLPLMIVLRLEDPRFVYLWSVGTIDLNTIRVLVGETTIPIIMLHGLTSEVQSLAPILDGQHNFYCDTCGMRYGIFPIETLRKTISVDSLLYGSSYPLLCAKAASYVIERADIPEEEKEKMLFKNAERVFNL